jgi:S-methyl-5-thioribose-1-phosphate isomerase
MIDQNLLPFDFRITTLKDYKETCMAIKNMTVRGAGAIGATAGFAMAQAFLLDENIDKAKKAIESTRPTAQNLFYAVNRVYQKAIQSTNPKAAALEEAQAIADEDAESCRLIGEHGKALIGDSCSIETHCNAGWLAFVDHGSALSPVYSAAAEGKKVHVYVDETRPRGQGARLTAWELFNEKIPHEIIPDNAGAHIMSKGMVDIMIVGADRIAANGDAANKIGTLEKAICAKEYGIPFYIAAPTSTFDPLCASGKDIVIEERSGDEVLYQTGPDSFGNIHTIAVTSPGSGALNFGFDVTPAQYITGIITEKGIIKPGDILATGILRTNR